MTKMIEQKLDNENNITILAYRNGKLIENFELKNFEAIYLDYHIDKITFLGNRELLRKILNNKEEDKILIFIDIKDFGSINEAYGEDFGDVVLNELSKKIKSVFFEFEAFRVGGDIFALLLKENNGKYTPENIKRKIDKFFLNPFSILNEKLNLCSTVAFVQGRNNLINKAEITIREAKQNNKSFLQYNKLFASKRKERFDEYKIVMSKIITAIKENRVYPVFQPIYSNITSKIEKYEALVRLRTAEGEELSPFMFLDIAKKNNQYSEITKTMVSKTLAIFNDKNYGISINLSLHDITNSETVDFILEQVSNFKNPSRLSFEILEDESIVLLESNSSNANCEKTKAVNRFFNTIKKLGCSIAIDDFGAGYSNFINILKLKPQIIKIDGSIISKLNEKEVRIIVELLVEYSQKIGCEIIAEYVSDKNIQEMVKALKITYSQGYFIGKPSNQII